MSDKNPQPAITTLNDLHKRLKDAETVVVDSSGRLYKPDDPAIANVPPDKKTTLKPQRWFTA